MRTVLAVVVVLVVVGVLATAEGAFMLLFGWIPFLGRVLPDVRPDGPSVAVGAVALALFAAGVHVLGRSVRGAARWRLRWTLAVVVGVPLLFAAGIAVIGVSHQLAWLATADQPAVGKSLQRGMTAETSAKEIGYGLTNYHDTFHTLPPGGTFAADGTALHSWETHLLPYFWSYTSDIDLKQPWDGPENERYFRCVLPNFVNPGFRTPPLEDDRGFGLSHYAANSRVMAANTAVKLDGLPNGAANTIIVGEVNANFRPWGHPLNFRDAADPRAFGGPAAGTLFLMADGSVRVLGKDTDPAVRRALAGP